MCPSYRYSHDHVKSPKGYSGLMREWLRLMTERQVDIDAAEQELLAAASRADRSLGDYLKEGLTYLKNLGPRTYHTIFERDDFNHEYLGHVATCLACKSCKTQCPAHVNAAELNSRFLNFYYSRYLRPSMDLLTLNAERTTPLMARFPKIGNALMDNGLSKFLLAKVCKFVDVPRFNSVPLAAQAKVAGIPCLKIKEATERAAHYDVIVVTNAFTAGYEADALIEWAQLIKALGFRVAILKPYTNGKLMVIRGARGQFIKCARKQAVRLSGLYNKGVTLVGFDPALTICYRDEYPSLVPNCPEFKVLLPEEWLKQALASEQFLKRATALKEQVQAVLHESKAAVVPTEVAPDTIPECNFSQDFYLFCHCTEQALVPTSVRMWQEIFAHFGLSLLPIPVACCGMAGLFGHMRPNQEESRTVYEQNWQGKLHERPFAQCLVTGFSCRSQVARMEGKRANHPIHVLNALIKAAQR